MNERAKLEEARYFLDRMHTEQRTPRAFRHELSAFLGASRSVLQYAFKEAATKTGGQHWYQTATAEPQFVFFRNLRDVSTHDVPVTPLTTMKLNQASMLDIGDDDDPFVIPYRHNTSILGHEFADRPGEEVLELSRQYLIALEQLVESGVTAGWITG